MRQNEEARSVEFGMVPIIIAFQEPVTGATRSPPSVFGSLNCMLAQLKGRRQSRMTRSPFNARLPSASSQPIMLQLPVGALVCVQYE